MPLPAARVASAWAPLAWGPRVTVTAEEAASSTARRLERDLELAAWHLMDHGEATAFWNVLERHDADKRAREAQEALAAEREAQRLLVEVVDSRPNMLARVNEAIALLTEEAS